MVGGAPAAIVQLYSTLMLVMSEWLNSHDGKMPTRDEYADVVVQTIMANSGPQSDGALEIIGFALGAFYEYTQALHRRLIGDTDVERH